MLAHLAKDVPPADIIAIAQELLPTLTAITYGSRQV
jgi:hypothetical protein